MTSKGWNNLPVELLRQVFDHLHHSIVANHPRTGLHNPFAACQLVCRSWSREAQKRLYNEVILGENIAKFIRTVAVEASQTASLVKHVHFLGSLTNDYQLEYTHQLFAECGELTSIKADSPEAFNQIIWPTLLHDDVHLPKLQRACLFAWNRSSEDLLIQFQLKYRHSLTTVHIKSVVSDKHYMRSLLQGFRAVKTVNINYCSSTQLNDLDAVLDKCASTLERLDICILDCVRWSTSSFGNIVPSEKLQMLSINRLRCTDSAPLQYILCKFPNVSRLSILSLGWINASRRIEGAFWNYLLRLYSRIACVHLKISLGMLDLPSLVANSLHFLLQLNRNKRDFSITFRDILSRPGMSGSSGVTLIKSEELLSFGLVTAAHNNSRQEVWNNIHDWIQLYKPTHVVYTVVEPIGAIYKMFFEDENTVANAMVRALPERFSDKSWKLLMETINTADEIELEHAVLCNSPPPSILFNHIRQGPLSTLKFSTSIINCTALPEISRRLSEIGLLTFHCTNILRQEKHTLDIFMPFTKVNRLYVNAASLEAKIWPGKMYDYDSSSPSNDEPLPYSKHYTLKIETDSGTAIYTIRGQDIEKRMDLSADEVTCGDRNNLLVWVKCKSFGKYGIFCKDGLWSYYDFHHE